MCSADYFGFNDKKSRLQILKPACGLEKDNNYPGCLSARSSILTKTGLVFNL